MIDPELLHAYCDGELTKEELAQVELQLREDRDLQAELRSIQSVKHVLKTKGNDLDHIECWKLCSDRLRQIDSARRTEHFVGRYAWAMAAGIVGLIVFTGVANRGIRTNSVEGGDLAAIMSQVGPGRRSTPTDLEEQRMAAEMLQQARLVIDPDVVHITGMAESEIEGMLVRRINLRDGNGAMALLDLPRSVQLQGMREIRGTHMMAGEIDTYNCLAWSENGRLLVLVGNRDHDGLSRVATLIHSAP